MAELTQRLELIETELAVRKLAHRYCLGGDQRNLEVWRSVWTDDAVWDTGNGPLGVFRGKEAITEAIQHQWEAFSGVLHATSNHEVDIQSSERASGRADVIVLIQAGTEERAFIGSGVYLDDYVRTVAGWRIHRRRAELRFEIRPTS